MKDTVRLAPFVKWRLYRFSDDLDAHVVVEHLEDLVRRGRRIPRVAEEEISRFLSHHEITGSVAFAAEEVAAALGIDVAGIVRGRVETARSTRSVSRPRHVICILGAPRSGTSNLFNRVIHTSSFATFTDHSHHLWHREQLEASRSRFLREWPRRVLERDTRSAKLDPSISWPSEAENILHRALPVYRHMGGHRYALETVREEDPDLLRIAVGAHLDWFGSATIVLKSPFNVLRMKLLPRAIGGSWSVVHIRRDRQQAARSIQRNRFRYWLDGNELAPEEVAAWFAAEAERFANLEVGHEDVLRDPDAVVGRIIDLVSGT